MHCYNIRSKRTVVGCCGLLGLVVVGCGDGRPTRVPVSGTVLIDGQPLAHGSIMFVHPQSRPAGSSLDSQGRFVLACYEPGDGAIPGRQRVAITGVEQVNERTNRWHAPKRYGDVSTSGIEVEITQPVDDLVIEITWDGGQPFTEGW